jgi:apolipoprotein N-acyltransferase
MALQGSPADVKAMIEQRPNTLGHVRLINQVEDETLRTKLISQVLNKELTRNQLEKQIERLKNKPKEIVVTPEECVPYTSSEKNHNTAGKNQSGIEPETKEQSLTTQSSQSNLANDQSKYEAVLLKLEDNFNSLKELIQKEKYSVSPDYKKRIEKLIFRLQSLII